jgi:hypothetical protein
LTTTTHENREDTQKVTGNCVDSTGNINLRNLINQIKSKSETDLEEALLTPVTSANAMRTFPSATATATDYTSFGFYITTTAELANFQTTGTFVCELDYGNLILWDTARAALAHCAYNVDGALHWYTEHGLPSSGTEDSDWIDSNCQLVFLPLSTATVANKITTADYKRFNRLYFEYSTVIKSAWNLTESEKANCFYWPLNRTHRDLRTFIDNSCTHRHCQLMTDSTETGAPPYWINLVRDMYADSDEVTPRTLSQQRTAEALAGVQSMLGLVLDTLRGTGTSTSSTTAGVTGAPTTAASATI